MDWPVLSFLKDNCQDFWLHPVILKTVHCMLGYNTTSLDTVHKCKCTSKTYKPWLTKNFFEPVKMTCDQASTGYLQLALGKTDFLQCLQLVIMMIKVHYNNPSRGSCHRQLLSTFKRSFHTTLTRVTKHNLQSIDAVYFGNGNWRTIQTVYISF